MITYFMAWECDNKRGHSIYEFRGDISPRNALREMISSVVSEFEDSDVVLEGVVSAIQFNRVT